MPTPDPRTTSYVDAPPPSAILIVGAPELHRQAERTLRADAEFARCAILTSCDAQGGMAILQTRSDIDIVLLLQREHEALDLAALVSDIIGTHSGTVKAIMVRSPAALDERLARKLWRLGVADRLFTQPIDSRHLADSAAAVLRACQRNHAVRAVSDASRALEEAKTLRELAARLLAMLHEQGIGRPGGICCLLAGAPQARLMVVTGTGRYEATGYVPVARLEDRRAELIEHVMQERHSRYTEDAAALFVRTLDGGAACIFLALDTPLLLWQHRIIRVLMKSFSAAIAKAQTEQRLLRMQHATITSMASLAEYRDADTGHHVARVARAVTEIAQVLADRGHVDAAAVDRIGLASILHDIGKIAIPEHILLKPGPLDASERSVMQTHAARGAEILLRAARDSDDAALLRTAGEIARCHHERYDGTGYPAGLKREDIPVAARIVALVDVFDALVSTRPYKEAWPVDRAVETIRKGAGSHFDPQVVAAFLQLEERRKAADFLEWVPSMSVGEPALDMDHRQLIDIVNRLWIADNRNRQIISFVLDDLVSYTESHFKREEAIMKASGYPEAARHAAIHGAICARLEQIRWEYFHGIRDELGGAILDFLKDWLNKHILVEDMAYRPYLVRCRERSTRTMPMYGGDRPEPTSKQHQQEAVQ